MDHLPTEMRLSSTARGFIIAAVTAVYAWLMHQPGASFTWALTVAGALQFAIIVLRRVLPPDLVPVTLYVFELLADAATVFLFALGVYGGTLAHADAL
jgi:hypothetical protein